MNQNDNDINQTNDINETDMAQDIVGVRFKEGGKTYFFSPNNLKLHIGDGVIVETVRGMEFATVVLPVSTMEKGSFPTPLRNCIRIATWDDREKVRENRENEAYALEICTEKIKEHGLDMRLTGCEYSFDGSRITFFFIADDRVDFRALVKDLASVFRTRIELRQIGVRDKAKMLGGIGSCGRAICCSSFLHTFVPVSIKMAKDQNIALSPSKISGVCGRLMCCLKYEQEAYIDARKRMPVVNHEVTTPDGPGTVIENNMLTEKVKVKLILDDGSFDVRDYKLSEITRKTGDCACSNDQCPDRDCSTCNVRRNCADPENCPHAASVILDD